MASAEQEYSVSSEYSIVRIASVPFFAYVTCSDYGGERVALEPSELRAFAEALRQAADDIENKKDIPEGVS